MNPKAKMNNLSVFLFYLSIQLYQCIEMKYWRFNSNDTFKFSNATLISQIQCVDKELCDHFNEVDCAIRPRLFYTIRKATGYNCFLILNNFKNLSSIDQTGNTFFIAQLNGSIELRCNENLNEKTEKADCYVQINFDKTDLITVLNELYRSNDVNKTANENKIDNKNSSNKSSKKSDNFVAILLVCSLAIFMLIAIPVLLALVGYRNFWFCFCDGFLHCIGIRRHYF